MNNSLFFVAVIVLVVLIFLMKIIGKRRTRPYKKWTPIPSKKIKDMDVGETGFTQDYNFSEWRRGLNTDDEVYKDKGGASQTKITRTETGYNVEHKDGSKESY